MPSWSRAVLLGTALALCLAPGHSVSTPPLAKPPKKQTLPKVEAEAVAEAAQEAAEEPEAAAAEAVAEETEAELPEEEVEEEEEEVAAPPIAIDAPTAKTASAPSPAAAGSKASVQFMITADMKEKLLALGYSEEDIAQLQPERARVIVNRGLKRTSKLPASWTRSAQRDGPIVGAWRRIKQHTTTPAGMAGLAAGGLATLLAARSSRPQPNFALAARPKANAKPANAKAAKAEAPSKAAPAPPSSPSPPSSPPTHKGLWLDVQIDKLIAFFVRPAAPLSPPLSLATHRRWHPAPRTPHHAPRTLHHVPRTTHHAPRTTHHARHALLTSARDIAGGCDAEVKQLTRSGLVREPVCGVCASGARLGLRAPAILGGGKGGRRPLCILVCGPWKWPA